MHKKWESRPSSNDRRDLCVAAVGQPDWAFIALKQRLESGSVPLSHGKSTTRKTSAIFDDFAGKETRETTTEVFFDQELYTRDTDRLLHAANALFMATFAEERGASVPESTTNLVE